MEEDDIRKMGKKRKDMTLAELLVEIAELLVGVEGPLDRRDLRGLWVTFHQRIAFSFASLVFMFIGIPIAVIVKRGEVVVSFGISMAAMGTYYILFATAQAIASRSGLPPVI